MKIDARGEQCPIPVVKAKEAIKQLGGNGQVEVLVDNEIAVQNLLKMAGQKNYAATEEKLGESDFKIVFTVGDSHGKKEDIVTDFFVADHIDRGLLVAISADTMGTGDESLGKVLLKGFIYALAKADALPASILFYNRGAFMTTLASDSLEDLKELEIAGVEILTCGTCLNHYGLTEHLAVGSVTNMYTIVEKMTAATKVIKP